MRGRRSTTTAWPKTLLLRLIPLLAEHYSIFVASPGSMIEAFDDPPIDDWLYGRGTRTTNCQQNLHKIEFDQRMRPILRHLGLLQVAQLPKMQLDVGLLSGLIERWRSETHTFHMPHGKMTVILEDVLYLWGLSIIGEPIMGIKYMYWFGIISQGISLSSYAGLCKKRKMGEDWKVLNNSINLPRLREHFSEPLPTDASPEHLGHYTRAFIIVQL